MALSVDGVPFGAGARRRYDNIGNRR